MLNEPVAKVPTKKERVPVVVTTNACLVEDDLRDTVVGARLQCSADTCDI